MKDCFALRFQLNKSGYNTPENTELFAGMFGEDVNFLEECLCDYDSYKKQALSEIISQSELEILRKKFDGKKMLFMGDSITSDRLSYHKLLELAFPGQVFDGAISGYRSANVLNDIEKYLEGLKPDIVSVFIGTNDSSVCDRKSMCTTVSIDEYRRNLLLIAQQITESGAKLILNTFPPCFTSNDDNDADFHRKLNAVKADFNKAVKETAEKTGAVLNDLNAVFDMEHLDGMFEPDGGHPSPYAHKLMAKEYLNLLKQIRL